MVGKICPTYWDRVNVSENLGVTAVINKSPLHNGKCPITDPITKMEVAHWDLGWVVG